MRRRRATLGPDQRRIEIRYVDNEIPAQRLDRFGEGAVLDLPAAGFEGHGRRGLDRLQPVRRHEYAGLLQGLNVGAIGLLLARPILRREISEGGGISLQQEGIVHWDCLHLRPKALRFHDHDVGAVGRSTLSRNFLESFLNAAPA